jgi:hypothetical protein
MKPILRGILLGAMLLALFGLTQRTTCERCQPPDCAAIEEPAPAQAAAQEVDGPAPTLAPPPAAPSLAVQMSPRHHRSDQVIYVTVEAEQVATDRAGR